MKMGHTTTQIDVCDSLGWLTDLIYRWKRALLDGGSALTPTVLDDDEPERRRVVRLSRYWSYAVSYPR